MKNKKKLLLAGGGYADIPLIQSAQNLGYYVVTTGNRPEELGHMMSDEYHSADYSDPDAMLKLAREIGVDAICPCCNDFSAISCAYVAEQLGLPGHDPYEISKLIHHKDSYRKFALEYDIPTPKAMGFTELDVALSSIDDFMFPLLVKPVDLSGGKGITKIEKLSEAKNALESAFSISKSGRIVIEEFIDGTRHGFSAFIRDGKVVFYFADDEHYYLNQYMVSAASTPTTAPQNAINQLAAQTQKIARILSLKTGIFHVQFIMYRDEPVIIEICRRSPGDLYIKLVQHATGVDYPSWIVRASCGLDCSGLNHKKVDGYYLRHCVMASRSGVLENIIVSPSIKNNIIDSMMWWQQGDRVVDHLVAKFGIVFLKFNSLDELLTRSGVMQELIFPRVKPI